MSRQLFDPTDPRFFTPRQVFAILASVCVPYLTAFVLFVRYMKQKPAKVDSAVVVVLGDFGRSPRMMYHADSLRRKGWEVGVVAYDGELGGEGLVG